jgi:FkbH-like protein
MIALDCDLTLWDGVCGEDPVEDIQVGPPQRALQELMVRHHEAGTVLALCSRNQDTDVFAMFRHHQSMPLKLQHLKTWRINWDPVSLNMRALAEEQRVPLEECIYISADPVTCEEVRTACPGVLVVQLPADSDTLLHHVWALDLPEPRLIVEQEVSI